MRFGTLVRAYRLDLASMGGIGCLLAMLAFVDVSVGVGGAPIRSIWFLGLAANAFTAVMLRSAFAPLSSGSVRNGASRAFRGCWHLLITFAVVTVLGLVAQDPTLVAWFALLQAVSVLVSIVRQDLASLTSLGFGTLTILVDHLFTGLPVSRLLSRLGPGWCLAVYAVSVCVFVFSARFVSATD